MDEPRNPWAGRLLAAAGLAWTGWAATASVTDAVTGPVTGLAALSGLLLAVGLVTLVLTREWTYRFPGGEGAGLAAVGSVSFAAGQVVVLVRGPGGLAPWLLAPGVLGLVGGSVLLGVGVARARRLPPWIGIGIALGSVLFLGFNVEPVLALPSGLAWLGFGWTLSRHPERPAEPVEPSAISR